MTQPFIPVIIPSYEPDYRLIQLLEDLRNLNTTDVIVVNDGSGCDYDPIFAEARERYGATVLSHEKNNGKGRSLKTAFEYCLKTYPDMLGCVTADSDGQHKPKDIKLVANGMMSNQDCLTLGARDFGGDHIPAKSKFGNNLTKKVFKGLFKVELSDTQTGLRGIPTDLMKQFMSIGGDRFEYETNMLIYVIENQIGINEVTIDTIYENKENHSTHFRPVVDSIKIYASLGRSFFKFALSSFL